MQGDGDDARVGEASHDGEEFEEEIPDADVLRGFGHGSSAQEENLDRIAVSSVHSFINIRSIFVQHSFNIRSNRGEGGGGVTEV